MFNFSENETHRSLASADPQSPDQIRILGCYKGTTIIWRERERDRYVYMYIYIYLYPKPWTLNRVHTHTYRYMFLRKGS